MPCFCLQFVIVVFPDHTQLQFFYTCMLRIRSVALFLVYSSIWKQSNRQALLLNRKIYYIAIFCHVTWASQSLLYCLIWSGMPDTYGETVGCCGRPYIEEHWEVPQTHTYTHPIRVVLVEMAMRRVCPLIAHHFRLKQLLKWLLYFQTVDNNALCWKVASFFLKSLYLFKHTVDDAIWYRKLKGQIFEQ